MILKIAANSSASNAQWEPIFPMLNESGRVQQGLVWGGQWGVYEWGVALCCGILEFDVGIWAYEY